MRKTGVYLMILGLVLTILTVVTLFTRESIVNVGDIEISIRKPHYFQWAPIIGVGIIICGGTVVLMSPGKSK